MSDISLSSHSAALQMIQQAVVVLAKWAKADSWLAANNFGAPNAKNAKVELTTKSVAKAQEILGWAEHQQLDCLRLVFDRVQLTHHHESTHYRPAWAIETQAGAMKTPAIPYARGDRPTTDDLEKLKQDIQAEINHLNPQNLSQLTLFVEKFGSHLSFGEPDIALIDLARSTAAVAAALAQQPPDDQVVLVAGDLMGVQKFIYTISSDGALKSLRARSFFLEITTEEIVYRLLDTLNLPRPNIIYAGASKFYILAPKTDQTCQTVQDLQDEFNKWLRENFQKKIFLAMAVGDPFAAKDLSPGAPLEGNTTQFSKHWQGVNKKLSDQAFRKFDRNITEILKEKNSHEPCKVCHRDDTTDLQPLNDEGSVEACSICRKMFALGGELLKAEALIRSNVPCEENDRKCFEVNQAYYRVVTETETHRIEQLKQNEAAFQINCWDLETYKSDRIFPIVLGNYGKSSEKEPGFMSAREFAEKSRGIERVGYLRMDIDRLGQIFGQGLKELHILPRLMGLSRQMTYFFKVYLNSLAEHRFKNLPSGAKILNQEQSESSNTKENRKDLRLNLLFIYAGGDDLFVSGSWDEVVEFAFDLYQSFRAYTGCHPDITLSAGICIEDAKFPLYQAASRAGELEDDAKANQRDSLALFDQVFKWGQWLGKPGDYSETVKLTSEAPDLFGIFPFVKTLQSPDIHYPSSFIQNLLLTAQVQEKAAKASLSDKSKDFRHTDTYYFLHLPRLAYTLRELPKSLQDTKIRPSLLNTHNSPYFRAIATWIQLLNRE